MWPLAANRLNGVAGSDTLTGGSGTDTCLFSTSLAVGDVDLITAFATVDDVIWLDDAVFTSLVAGALTAAAFKASRTGQATDASDRILYEKATGEVYFDEDGNGAIATAALWRGSP